MLEEYDRCRCGKRHAAALGCGRTNLAVADVFVTWSSTLTAKPHLHIGNDVFAKCVHTQTLLLQAWRTCSARGWNMTCALRWQDAWSHSWHTSVFFWRLLQLSSPSCMAWVLPLKFGGKKCGFILLKELACYSEELTEERVGGDQAETHLKYKSTVFLHQLLFPVTS